MIAAELTKTGKKRQKFTHITKHHLYCMNGPRMYRVRQNKVAPVKFFAVFSATVWNFYFKLYFIFWHVLHLTAKWNVILLKNDEVTLFNITAYRFLALKMFKLQHQFNYIADFGRLCVLLPTPFDQHAGKSSLCWGPSPCPGMQP